MAKTTKQAFSIIELLIVIVVIGVLAAVVMLTYQSAQNRANNTAAEQNAHEVVSKAIIFNQLAGHFPRTVAELKTANDGDQEYPGAKLDDKVINLVKNSEPTADFKNHVQYQVCQKIIDDDQQYVGAKAIFWNYEANRPSNESELIKAGETSGDGVSCAAPID